MVSAECAKQNTVKANCSGPTLKVCRPALLKGFESIFLYKAYFTLKYGHKSYFVFFTKRKRRRVPTLLAPPLLTGALFLRTIHALTNQQFFGLGDNIFTHTKLSTTGTSTIVDVSDIKRSRYCIQVTMYVLYRLLKIAHVNSKSDLPLLVWLFATIMFFLNSFFLEAALAGLLLYEPAAAQVEESE